MPWREVLCGSSKSVWAANDAATYTVRGEKRCGETSAHPKLCQVQIRYGPHNKDQGSALWTGGPSGRSVGAAPKTRDRDVDHEEMWGHLGKGLSLFARSPGRSIHDGCAWDIGCDD